ncbi:ATP-binding cassette domain-containing protein [Desulforamulus ruminis]|uniref:ABC transporter ATP-binding protein n=1 Tax=Desulforamulus ruminis (strain ATCC 23193 / DSM 2154 / NCIMB 8452 / DL) TaxID=696281 RepID=F6DL51_DESRL|nr:ATP-binding cassette domain-containing protein [Desulforamulus ruminis]AEG59272.1 cobalt ABC transporter, ATPase subunit [Desulforamulus ruminis DSM 2154]
MVWAFEVKDLSFQYKDGTKALDRLTLNIERGSRVALLGPNGSGKTTLLLHFNAIHPVQQGTLKVLGEVVTAKNEKWVRDQVGLVFQDPDDQLFSSSVWEDVAFGPVNQGLQGETLKERVREALRFVNMEAYAAKVPYHLSYGQKKRVAIAGVIAMNPEMIVLDEPLAFLDPAGKRELFSLLDRLKREGKTIVMATHDVDMAVQWADKVLVMKDGRLVAEGSPRLLTDREIVESAHLEFPTVSRIFLHFPSLCGETVPATVQEAVAMIEGLLAKNESK